MSYCLAMKVKIRIVEREKEQTKATDVAYWPRFGGDSQACTPQFVWISWRGSAGQGPAISYETGTRQAGFSRVYKYQLATHVE